jgi:AAT family amino acid transporter
MEGDNQLHRGLAERHISLMALGVAVGVGLFLGSATAIRLAGPAILLVYAAGGAAVFFIMRALGEMAVENPVSGSFCHYANQHIGPLAGFLVGWTYWFTGIFGGMCEISAVGIYMQMWFPHLPTWIWALASLISVTLLNLAAVRVFGEMEFWFALVKVVAIVGMIVLGIGMLLFGAPHHGEPFGVSNLWTHGGFAPHGIRGMLLALPMVAFAYQGVEMIGLTAGEARAPEKTLARAINSVFWRVLVFYVGALFVIMSLYPWDRIGTEGSPFVTTLDRVGIRSAAGIINFVVVTAALSACNSSMFGGGRLVHYLANQRHAPALFGRTSSKGVPVRAVLGTAAVLLVGVGLNYIAPAKVFVWVASISTFGALLGWSSILVAQYRSRRARERAGTAPGKFRMPLFPYGNYFAGLFLGVVVAVLLYGPDTRDAFYVGPA